MDIAVYQVGEELGCEVAGPDTGISQIEALGWRKAVACLLRLLLHTILESTIGHLQSTVVADVLAKGLLTVNKESGQCLLLREPVGKHLRALIILSLVFSCPPVHQIAVLVELTALIVEAVAHLVADDGSNSTVVADIISLWIKEWGLQDGSGEVDAVEQRVVESVHRLRCATHLGLIDGLAPVFTQLGGTCLFFDADEVLYEVLILADINILLHILPLVGVAHINIYSMQLRQRLGLGGVAHPGILIQTVLEGLLQVFHQTMHALLAGLREILLDIELTDGLAQMATDHIDGTLPAGLLFLHTADGLAGFERTVGKCIAKVTTVGLGDP